VSSISARTPVAWFYKLRRKIERLKHQLALGLFPFLSQKTL
jgi:hypothetical protein